MYNFLFLPAYRLLLMNFNLPQFNFYSREYGKNGNEETGSKHLKE